MFACVLLAGPIFYPEEQISWQDTQSHYAVPDRAQLARLSRGWQCQCRAGAELVRQGFHYPEITAWQEELAAANPALRLSLGTQLPVCSSASKTPNKAGAERMDP